MNQGSAREAARAAQLAASDPAVSAFTSASAGSGKTKLLTDRLLRLMLGGAKPGRILCLTFTRAAAAEMALRLQRRLANWAVAPDEALDSELTALGTVPDETTRRLAKRLFAEVLDLPGGMRINTIHAFCQSVLQRFPLEAALPPHFEVTADEDAALARNRAVREVLARALDDPARAAAIARLVEATTSQAVLDTSCAEIAVDDRFWEAQKLPPLAREAAFRRATGAPEEAPDLTAVADQPALIAAVKEIAEHARTHKAKTSGAKAEKMSAWLALPIAERSVRRDEWFSFFFRVDGEPRAPRKLVNEALAKKQPALRGTLLREQERLLAVLDAERAEAAALLSRDLYALATPALAEYGKIKEAAGRLDYADLIRRTSRLLVDPGAAWVLYKLDGGLDHLLLDEAQDTAPAQWEIAAALTAEFFAGEGAREGRRTVFAVGDPKQSIFSFQGAEPAGFERARVAFGARVKAAGEAWVEQPLNVSFRSTAPVLALVDAVFADPRAARGVASGELLRHAPVRLGAGSVELWPLAPRDELPNLAPWSIPKTNLTRISGERRLASTLARWIARESGGSVQLPGRARTLAPGDVLVLVRRRNAFGRALVRALKAEGVPVSGLDRMSLAEEPAVRDVLALARAILLPEDDLAFATFLTSPLGGLDDEHLLELCPRRRVPLFKVLESRRNERPAWRAAYEMFTTLFQRADFVSPHALFAEALGPLGGRTRLYARFGMEAAEPLDELLAAALRYAAANVPSLQGFVHWTAHAGTEVKREPEGMGTVVRLMTVHGAKGLEAPLVILPDTTNIPDTRRSRGSAALLAAPEPASRATLPLYAPDKRYRSAAIQGLLDSRQGAAMAEYNRLLYVALTRAEDRLVVAGWAMDKSLPDDCWYRLVERGFARLGAEPVPFSGDWVGSLLRFSSEQTTEPEPDRMVRDHAGAAPLPRWAGSGPDWHAVPPPLEADPPVPLAPSRPENVSLGLVPALTSPLSLSEPGSQRFRRGTLVHAALQYLGAVPSSERAVRLRHFLGASANGLGDAEVEQLAVAIENVIARPDLAPLFGADARAEVPLTGLINGRVVGGLVDRLAILSDRVLIADFKTNRHPPATPAETPPLYLAQMAAYRAVLREIFPDRPVLCLLVWTEALRVDLLADAVLDLNNPILTGAQRFPA